MLNLKSNRLAALLTYSIEHRTRIIVATLYSIINKFFDIFPEILIGVAIDVVIEREHSVLAKLGVVEPDDQLFVLAILTFFVWFFESVTEYGANIYWRNLAQEIQHKLRSHGSKHIQQLSLAWFENQNSGQLLTILNEDVNQVERFLNSGLHNLIQLVVSSILVGAVFFYLSPLVACFAILPIPIIVLGGFRFKDKLAARYGIVRQKAAQLGEKLSGMITGNLTIRAQVAEDAMLKTIQSSSQAYIDANQDAIRLSSAFVPVIRMGVLAGFLVTLVLGGLKTLDGSLAPSAFTVLVFLTQRLLWPFTRFGEVLDLYERSMASTARVLGLIEEPIEQQALKKTDISMPIKGAIGFKHLDFAYDDNPRVLTNFNLDIKSGDFIGIVGPTGSGKSTIVKLLLRFYSPQSGSIELDGLDIQAMDSKQLRKAIGYVGQDTFLMDGSIRENLLLGRTSMSDVELYSALEQADAKGFVEALSNGIDTKVGERGQKLSGGQRQRLAIARGILGNPPILIFDEATSAVDNETEESIHRSIKKLAEDRTMIVIAHRLSTIRHADKIIVLDKGKITEQGTHDELVANNGLYHRLWQLQSGE